MSDESVEWSLGQSPPVYVYELCEHCGHGWHGAPCIKTGHTVKANLESGRCICPTSLT